MPRQASDAKKTLAAARKEIGSILKLQQERLYESMCTQRTWTFADWDQFLNKHPIIRHYSQRLVWCVTAEGKITKSFRPLDDGTLTDTDDNGVTVADDGLVCLAHESILPADAVKAWRRHLADYDVRPLFEQFNKGSFRLPDDKRGASSLEDFQGYILEAFKLRGRLTKLGYSRGPGLDGGRFYHYHKHFPGVAVIATIEFTGNALPEENRTVALSNLHFTRPSGGQESAHAGPETYLPMNQVPTVLLSECWNDMKLASAVGPGFDPDWQKKTSG